MTIRLLSSDADLALWAAFAGAHGTLWQSPAWRRYQESLGRHTRVYGAWEGPMMTGAALVTIDRTIGGLATWDIARGPVFLHPESPTNHALMDAMARDARADRCMTLFASPESTAPLRIGQHSLRDSCRCEQSPATRIIDLTPPLDNILAQMHQKGRYNIKIALRDGVTVRRGTAEDIDAFYALLRSTSARDVFTIGPKTHYARFLTDLEGSFFLIAEHQNTPVAGVLGVEWNGTGFYYYGASDHAKRALMAPYLLQWEAMQLCKSRGCSRYDLLGIAPPGSGNDHPWAGISSFKEKFGGRVITYPPEQQLILRPFAWRALQWKRRILG